MNEADCLSKMVAPGTPRKGKYREGVIQILVTRACDKACFGCTQGSNLAGKQPFMSLDNFQVACASLSGYFGVVGMFGGNPATHPQFKELCDIVRACVPWEQRGIWCNNPLTVGQAQIMQLTFNPAVSNLNVHLDEQAFKMFKEGWPECSPVGLHEDSRHSPWAAAMKDLAKKACPRCGGRGHTLRPSIELEIIPIACPDCQETGKVVDEARIWELISGCDINQHWSASLGEFRGQLRAWFCELAMAQSHLHQWDKKPLLSQEMCDPGEAIIDLEYLSEGRNDPSDWSYPDTGMIPFPGWWRLPMEAFKGQVRKHCFECGVPLRGHGELAQAADGKEQCSQTHAGIFRPKRAGRQVEVVTDLVQLGVPLQNMVRYLQNAGV